MLRNQELMTPWGFVPWVHAESARISAWALASWLDVGVIPPIVFVVSAGLVVVGFMDHLAIASQHNESLILRGRHTERGVGELSPTHAGPDDRCAAYAGSARFGGAR